MSTMVKKLDELLENLNYRILQGQVEGEISSVVYDSRKAEEGCLFVCIRGSAVDGHQFAGPVADLGAKVLVVEEPVDVRSDVCVIQVHDTRKALAEISAAYFGHPAEQMKVIGITGTKGKTTTTYMIKSILENSGCKCGLIGTIETIIGETHIPAKNTTPESYIIQETFSQMVDAGMEYVVMEVSSQGLMMKRVDGILFDLGIFTNIEPDHIGPNEHRDFDDYLNCKRRLFRHCKTGIFNLDDDHFERMIQGRKCEMLTFGFSEKADFRASEMELLQQPGQLGVSFQVSGKENAKVQVSVPGRFSVYNALASIAVCSCFGIPMETMLPALKAARVKGRIEPVPLPSRYPFAMMIDYAHNAMSLKSLLSTLREYRPGRLVCLFGCGGNRSKDRRYEMGEVSGNLADLSIITSDNPRFEEPQAIIDDIKYGINKTDGNYVEIIDRKEAIRYAIEHGQEGDVIVLAGKGHEDYQEIRGKKYPMDERILVQEVLRELGNQDG